LQECFLHTFTIIYFVAQAFGFLVEYISTPKALVDTTVHYRPVGPYEFSLWREGIELPSPIERYRNDPTALKIISQDQWTLDRPLYDIQATNTVVGAESDYFVQAQRRQNYFRCRKYHSNIHIVPFPVAFRFPLAHSEIVERLVPVISEASFALSNVRTLPFASTIFIFLQWLSTLM